MNDEKDLNFPDCDSSDNAFVDPFRPDLLPFDSFEVLRCCSLHDSFDPRALSNALKVVADYVRHVLSSSEVTMGQLLELHKYLTNPSEIRKVHDTHTLCISPKSVSLLHRVRFAFGLVDIVPRESSDTVEGYVPYSELYGILTRMIDEHAKRSEALRDLQQKMEQVSQEVSLITYEKDALTQKMGAERKVLAKKKREFRSQKHAYEKNVQSLDAREAGISQKKSEYASDVLAPWKQRLQIFEMKNIESFISSLPPEHQGEVRQLYAGTHGATDTRVTFFSPQEVSILNKVFGSGYFTMSMNTKQYKAQRTHVFQGILARAHEDFFSQLSQEGLTDKMISHLRFLCENQENDMPSHS